MFLGVSFKSITQLAFVLAATFQSYLGLLVFAKLLLSKRLVKYVIFSLLLSVPTVIVYLNDGSEDSMLLFLKVFLFGAVFLYAVRYFSQYNIRNIFVIAINVMQLVVLLDYAAGGIVFSRLFADGNIYDGRLGGFFEFDVGNYGLWSAFGVFAAYLHYRKFNLFVVMNLICCLLSGTRWPLLILGVLLFKHLGVNRRALAIIGFGAVVAAFIGGERSILNLLSNLIGGQSETLTAWLSITGPAFQEFLINGNIFFGNDLVLLYDSIDADPKFAQDSSVSVVFALGIVGTLGFVILFYRVIGMSSLVLWIVLLIGLKGLYIFNVYSALFLGFLQAVVYYNKYASPNRRL